MSEQEKKEVIAVITKELIESYGKDGRLNNHDLSYTVLGIVHSALKRL